MEETDLLRFGWEIRPAPEDVRRTLSHLDSAIAELGLSTTEADYTSLNTIHGLEYYQGNPPTKNNVCITVSL
jgi:hypothetical protein